MRIIFPGGKKQFQQLSSNWPHQRSPSSNVPADSHDLLMKTNRIIPRLDTEEVEMVRNQDRVKVISRILHLFETKVLADASEENTLEVIIL